MATTISQEEFLEDLRESIIEWQDDLAVLEDDAERSTGEEQDEYMEMIQDLFRSFEDLESRVDELEEMDDVDFEEELPLLEEKIQEFEQSLSDARLKIKDV